MFNSHKGELLTVSCSSSLYYYIYGTIENGVYALMSKGTVTPESTTAYVGDRSAVVDYIRLLNMGEIPVTFTIHGGNIPITSTIIIPVNGWCVYKGDNVTIYDDKGVQVVKTISVSGGNNIESTSDVPEGDNLYFTSDRVINTLDGFPISLFNNDVPYLVSIGQQQIISALGYLPYDSGNPDGYITSSALSTYALTSSIPTNNNQLTNGAGYLTTVPAQSWSSITGKPVFNSVATSGLYSDLSGKPDLSIYLTSSVAASTYQPIGSYLTSINSSQVISALGYAPYNSSNPSGYITSSALSAYALASSIPTNNNQLSNGSGYITSVPPQSWTSITSKPSFSTVATSGSYTDLSNRPSIPVVPTNLSSFTNDSGYITQSGARSSLSGANGISYDSSTGVISSISVTAYSIKNTSYVMLTTDRTVEVTLSGSIITLPSASGITGKIFGVKNTSEGSITLNTSLSQTIFANTPVNSIILNSGDYYELQSNGTNFILK